MGRIALLAWIATFGLAYAMLGGLLGRAIEGYDRAALSLLPAWVTLASVLVSCVLTAKWAAGLRERGSDAPASGRRRFLLGTLGVGGGLAASFAATVGRNAGWATVTVPKIFATRPPYKADQFDAKWAGSKVVSYRRLGRTEARVSDISMGSGSSTGGRQTVKVAREAIERGINYFDTAPDYAETGSENRLGEAMKGLRDQMFLATKFCRPTGHLGPGKSVCRRRRLPFTASM